MRRGYALLRRLTTPLPRLLPALAAALLVSGGVERPIVSRDAVRPDPAMCSADLLHPLQVELVPLDAPTPGKQVRVRVRVQAQARIDDVTVEVRPVGGISVVRDGELPLGLLPSGGSAETVFTVQLPNDRARRTVDFRANGHTASHHRRGGLRRS